MNSLSAAVAFFAGILTSFALEVVPGLREAWARQSSKRLILFVAHTLSPAVVWALACFIEFPFPFSVPCGRNGLLQVMTLGVTALAGNQGTYAVVVRHLPRVKARNKDRLDAFSKRYNLLPPAGSHETDPFTAQDNVQDDGSCDLCRLAAGYGGEIVTRLWLYRFDDVIVVTDLNAKGFAMRALAVPAEHVRCGAANDEMVRRCARALNEARAIIEEEHGLLLVKRDLHQHTILGHYHAQDCYRNPDGGEPWK
jgi:hypothetical protein